MITNKNTLREYLEADKKALGMKIKIPPLFGKEVWKFEISLRMHEYYLNTNRGGIAVFLEMDASPL